MTSVPVVRMTSGGVWKSGRWILKDVDLGLAKGDVLCLLGPNGAGKSTLLRCLAGLERLRTGRVEVAGEDLADLRPREVARRVAVLFQDHQPVFPYRTLDVVVAGRAPYLSPFSTPASEDYERAEAALRKVDAERLADRPFTDLSGGERQLVLIARALVQETPVLLLDEPTAHLDLRHETMVLETIAMLAARYKVGIVIASHSPNHGFLVASEVALMKNGAVAHHGPPERVLTSRTLREVFDAEVRVVTNGGDSGSFVVPVMRRDV